MLDGVAILEEIYDAFSGVPYPYGNDFFKALADRDYKPFVRNDRIKKWNDITESEILKYYDFIFFLEPGSILYYLPAYMKLIFLSDEVAQEYPSESFFMTIADLDIGLLNKSQREAVTKFLIFCRDCRSRQVEMNDDLINEALSHTK